MKDRIKTVRKSFHLTQAEFGEKIGISRNAIANLEYGRVVPTDIVMKAICREFNIDLLWLMTGAGNMFASDEDEIITAIDLIMTGENETAKSLFRALAKLDEDDWIVVQKIIDSLK